MIVLIIKRTSDSFVFIITDIKLSTLTKKKDDLHLQKNFVVSKSISTRVY